MTSADPLVIGGIAIIVIAAGVSAMLSMAGSLVFFLAALDAARNQADWQGAFIGLVLGLVMLGASGALIVLIGVLV